MWLEGAGPGVEGEGQPWCEELHVVSGVGVAGVGREPEVCVECHCGTSDRREREPGSGTKGFLVSASPWRRRVVYLCAVQMPYW